MPTIPCAKRVTCPCTDSPVSNYSAEDPDARRFQTSRYWTRKPKLGTVIGDHYLSAGCLDVCYSSESQQVADDCALAQAQECMTNDWQVPDPTNPSGPLIPFISSRNTQQSCSFTCPDGTVFTFVQRVGTVFGWSAFTANFWAYALACKRARESKVCLTKTCQPLCLNGVLNCLVSADWNGTGGEWAISGLPAWATATVVGNDLYLNGTADTAGNTDVIAVFTTPDFSFATLSFQIKVLGITNAAALPNGTIGTAYSQQLVGSGGTAPYSFGYESGTLPAGVTVNAAGLISGTPAGAADYTFTLYVRDSQGDSCFKEFTLTVAGAVPAPSAYLHLEGFVGGVLVDEIGANNWTQGTQPGTFAAGKSGNAWSGAGLAAGKSATNSNPLYRVNADPNGFTARMWFMIPTFGLSDPQYPIIVGSNWRIFVDWNGVVTFGLYRNTGIYVTVTNTLPSAGVWHHVMCYFDRLNNKIGIKINNGAASEAAWTFIFGVPVYPNYFGAMYNGPTDLVPFGYVDEFAFWKDRVLTDSEMTADYNGGAGLFWPW